MVAMQPAAGSLLIASATLVDPHFARCVLLILDSDPNGSLGVILNRPTDVPVGEVLTPWQDVTSEPGVFFQGGPVELNAAIAIGSLRPGAAESGDTPPGWQPLTGSIGIVDLDSSPDDFLGRLTGLRVYAGYAGWGAEQLDDEIAEGSWHVVPATESDPFSRSPDRLWGDVLRRQPPPLSMLATLPEDANLN
jgi:putative transcriptional regulator